MRNKILSLSLLALFVSACGNQTPTATEKAQQNNVNVAINKTDNTLTVSSRSQNNTQTASVPTGGNQTNASPMARAVDVAKLTEEIDKAKAAYDKNQKSDEAKNALAKAYFDRAFILTDAAQYRAAMGDFRKGLKLDPSDEKAKNMYDEIIRIFESIGREPPKEGEEPPPMPVK